MLIASCGLRDIITASRVRLRGPCKGFSSEDGVDPPFVFLSFMRLLVHGGIIYVYSYSCVQGEAAQHFCLVVRRLDIWRELDYG